MNALPSLSAAALASPDLLSTSSHAALPTGEHPPDRRIHHRSVDIDGVRVFYREAGPADAPAILLLHGYPSSSYMFRNLMPALADRYRLVAPDYPGFGHSDFPPVDRFDYTFDGYAALMQKFTRAVALRRYALYLQDYGGPVGMRVARAEPHRVDALVIQNSNAYLDGLGEALAPLQAYWSDHSPENRQVIRNWFSLEGMRLNYTAGMPAEEIELLSPDTWHLDWAGMSRPGNIEMQLDLFYDYRRNLRLYPDFQAYFRQHQPRTLIVWGRHDPLFTVAGAQAYLRDLPKAELNLVDAGHFALETRNDEIAEEIRAFLGE